MYLDVFPYVFNPLNAELNPICHLLALLGAHHILHVSRIRVNNKGTGRDYAMSNDRKVKNNYHLILREFRKQAVVVCF
jgi:hypothetical protein